MYIVMFDDCMGNACAYSLSDECEGGLDWYDKRPLALFPSRDQAKQAIKISKNYNRLLESQGKTHNPDWWTCPKFIRIKKVDWAYEPEAAAK